MGPRAVLPPGEIALPKLVERCAAACGRNILWNGREDHDSRPIALTEPVPLAPETALETLRSLLYTRGLGILSVDSERGILEVVAFAGQRGREFERQAAPATPEQVLAAPESRRWVVTSVRLRHTSPAAMSNVLRPLLPAGPGLSMGATVAMDGLTFLGVQSHVAAALVLIQQNDKPREEAAPDEAASLRQRVAALERELAELKQAVAELKKPAGK